MVRGASARAIKLNRRRTKQEAKKALVIMPEIVPAPHRFAYRMKAMIERRRANAKKDLTAAQSVIRFEMYSLKSNLCAAGRLWAHQRISIHTLNASRLEANHAEQPQYDKDRQQHEKDMRAAAPQRITAIARRVGRVIARPAPTE